MEVQPIIDQMPEEVLAKVQKAAENNGVTVEAFVEDQLRQQLSEEQLEAIAGGALSQSDVDLGIRADYDTGRGSGQVGVGARIRF